MKEGAERIGELSRGHGVTASSARIATVVAINRHKCGVGCYRGWCRAGEKRGTGERKRTR